MQNVEPRVHDRRQLQDLLRRAFSAPALSWLTATTVYPELHWSLTLSLKSALYPSLVSHRMLDAELLTLCRLPWFRRGWMPDWTRSLLQQMLTEEEKDRARGVVLKAIGLREQYRRRFGQHLDIRLADDQSFQTSRLKADNIMLKYLLPAWNASRRLFALPESLAKQIARKPRRRLTMLAGIGVLMVSGASLASLSLLPIDQCDLFAGSESDTLRIGPGTNIKVIRLFHAAKALAACKRAVDREPTNGRYWYQLARALDPFDKSESHKAGLKSAALNYPAGYNSVGFDFMHGSGVEVNFDKAKYYFEQAIALGNTQSLENLGYIAAQRHNEKESFDINKRLVDAGGYTVNLALFYRDGRVVKKDPEQYIRLLELGVRRRDGLAAAHLGYEYQIGLLSDKNGNYERANKFYELAVRWEVELSAAHNLAINYLHGNGIEQNYERATDWFILAAKLGYSSSLVMLHQMIQDKQAKFRPGFGPPVSFEASMLLQAAAEANDSRAQFEYAQWLEAFAKISNSYADREHAIAWYRKAAAQDYDKATKERATKALDRLGLLDKKS